MIKHHQAEVRVNLIFYYPKLNWTYVSNERFVGKSPFKKLV